MRSIATIVGCGCKTRSLGLTDRQRERQAPSKQRTEDD